MLCYAEWKPGTCSLPSSTSPPAAAPLTIPSNSSSSVAVCKELSSLRTVTSSVDSHSVQAERRVDVRSTAVSVSDAAVEVGESLLAASSQRQNCGMAMHSSSAVNSECATSTSVITLSSVIASVQSIISECTTSSTAAATAVPSSNHWPNSEVTRSSSGITLSSIIAAALVQSIIPACSTSAIALPSIVAASAQSNRELTTSATASAVQPSSLQEPLPDRESDSEGRFRRQQTEHANAVDQLFAGDSDHAAGASPVVVVAPDERPASPAYRLSCDEHSSSDVSGPLDNLAQSEGSVCTEHMV